jgi:hypothetical protein
MDNKDLIRLTEEQLESYRRRMVLQGKWKENESKKKLIECIKKSEEYAISTA